MISISLQKFWAKIRQSLPLLLLIYIPPIILLLVLGIISLTRDITPSLFFEEPATVMNFESYIGLVSYLGIVLWASSMAICFFTYAILRVIRKNKSISNFVLFSGFFTLILLLDDLFMIHEWVHRYSSEYIVFSIYIIIMIFILLRFRDVVLKTDYLFISLALIFFGLSIVVDTSDNLGFFSDVRTWRGARTILEDGFKFLGIISWLTYFTKVCITSLRSTSLT